MRKHWSTIFILSLGLLVAFTFQNCGRSDLQFEDLESLEISSFLSYPYSSAPKFYSDAFVFRPGSSNTFNQLRFLAVATYPEKSNVDISYEIKIQDAANQTLCPTQTGTLLAGSSSIEFDCTTSRSTNEVNIIFTTSAFGFQQVVNKKYH